MADSGFSIAKDVFSPHQCESLATAVCVTRRAGARNLMSNPIVASFARDSRLLQLASHALGTHAFPFRATLFEKSSTANWHVLWHQDRALPLLKRVECDDWGPWSTKSGLLYALAPVWALEHVVALRIHLDAATDANGPLRVIPGSHLNGIINTAEIAAMVNDVAATECLVGRGGVLTMRPLLLHSSLKATSVEPRRVLHIEYADRFDFGNGLRLCLA